MSYIPEQGTDISTVQGTEFLGATNQADEP